MQAVGQQQHPLGQVRQQAARQFPFGLAAAPEGGSQRIMQTDFQEHARGEFGKRGAPTPASGFLDRAIDLRRVGQTELGAIQCQQPPAAPERCGMAPPAGQRSQRALQQFSKDRPGQPGTPIRPGTVGQGRAEELAEVLGQSAGPIQEVKDERWQQLGQRHAGLAPPPRRHGGRRLAAQELTPRFQKTVRRSIRGSARPQRPFGFGLRLGLRTFLHPQCK